MITSAASRAAVKVRACPEAEHRPVTVTVRGRHPAGRPRLPGRYLSVQLRYSESRPGDTDASESDSESPTVTVTAGPPGWPRRPGRRCALAVSLMLNFKFRRPRAHLAVTGPVGHQIIARLMICHSKISVTNLNLVTV